MDVKAKSPQHSEDQENPNLVITITMKKMESGSAPSSDKNNNDGSAKSAVKASAKEFCKNLFNKTSSSGDKNNNQPPAPPVTNQYTKVTVDGHLSQISLHANHQVMSHGTAVAVNQLDANKR